MNWMNLLGLVYFGAHLEAGIFDLILCGVVFDVQKLGAAAWLVPAVCLALAAFDWTGRVPLSGPLGKLAAAVLLPPLCGTLDVLIRDKWTDSAPVVWGYFLSLFLLAAYVLLREPRSEEPLDRAAALLERGSGISVAELLWLHLLGFAWLLIGVFGSVIAVILGALLASQNRLLDYSGVRGWLLGVLALHLLQSILFLRGTRLARKLDPALHGGPLAALFLPVWNAVQASRLASRLRARRWQAEGYDRF